MRVRLRRWTSKNGQFRCECERLLGGRRLALNTDSRARPRARSRLRPDTHAQPRGQNSLGRADLRSRSRTHIQSPRFSAGDRACARTVAPTITVHAERACKEAERRVGCPNEGRVAWNGFERQATGGCTLHPQSSIETVLSCFRRPCPGQHTLLFSLFALLPLHFVA